MVRGGVETDGGNSGGRGGKEHEWRREEMTTEQGEERNLAAEE